MAEAKTIFNTDPDFPQNLDFLKLREAGIGHIQQLSGDIWTDHNLHDPGITILEVLCYALTDLAYRNQLDIKEILARDLKSQQEEDNFFTPAQILSCNPFTINDYRKLLIDIKGVKNAWLEVATEAEVQVYINCQQEQLQYEKTEHDLELNGLYNVYLELETSRPQDKVRDACGNEEIPVDRILREARERLHSHRNLGEDFLDIRILQDEEIGVCTDLVLAPDADPQEVLVEIYLKLHQALSPELKFYTLQQMLRKGKTIQEIFEGRPLLFNPDKNGIDSHGFIDLEELEELDLKTELHASDVYREILDVEGVLAIKKLVLFNYINGVRQTTGEKWCLKLTKNYRPIFSPLNSPIRFFKGPIPFIPDKELANTAFRLRLAEFRKVKRLATELDLPIPQGRFRTDLSQYASIQNEFPLTYGIGEGHLSESATPQRRAQALQLKGYLLFYDQLLANYLAQVGHIRDLFSMRPDQQRTGDEKKTYFTQEVVDAPQIDQLLKFNFSKNGQAPVPDKILARLKEDQQFSAPTSRDHALDGLIKAFQNQEIQVKTAAVNNGFRYHWLDQTSDLILEGRDVFAKEADARKQGEQLQFLGAFKGSFRLLNYQDEGQYAFEFIFNPLGYANFLETIAEKPLEYLKRRNCFMDHLLGRFAEDFTDYVLLMYALNGKRNTDEQIIEDKGHFLTNYPEISRNRGKAFDYTDESEIWDTTNVSGLERRVSRLMGIPEWRRDTLNHFCVVERNLKYYFQHLDHRDNLLFVSEHGFASEAEALQGYEHFRHLARHNERYRNIDCQADNVFTFVVLDDEFQPFARHVFTYPDPGLRDEIRECLRQTFQGDGLIKSIVSAEEGFYFLLNDEERRLIFKSARAYEEESQAWEAFHQFLHLAIDEDHYEKYSDPYGKGTGFFLQDEEGQVIARHPDVYARPKDCALRMQAVLKLIREKRADFRTVLLPQKYEWVLKTDQDAVLLKSAFQFKDPHHAAQLWLTVLPLAREVGQLEKFKVDTNFHFGISIDNQRVAISLPFENAADRDECLQLAVETAIHHGDLNESIIPKERGYRYQFESDAGKVLISSDTIYKNRKGALRGWKHFEEVGTKSAHYQIHKEEGLCQFYLELFDAPAEEPNRRLVARSLVPFSSREEARNARATIIHSLKKELIPFSDEEVADVWEFRVRCARLGTMLESAFVYATWPEAYFAYYEAQSLAQEINNYRLINDSLEGEYRFLLNDEAGHRLAIHPRKYPDAKERDQQLEKTVKCARQQAIHWQVETLAEKVTVEVSSEGIIIWQGKEQFENEYWAHRGVWSLLSLACHPENYLRVDAEDGCRYGFHLTHGELVVAEHPIEYLDENERERAITRLIDHAKRHLHDFHIENMAGSWHFEIGWITCDAKCEVLFVGNQEHQSHENAYQHLEKFLNYLYSGQAKIVDVDDEVGYSFEVVKKQGGNDLEVMAIHPKKYPTPSARDSVLRDAVAYLNFPKRRPPTKKIVKLEGDCIDEGKWAYQVVGDLMAEHPRRYSRKSERNQTHDRLLDAAQKNRLFYADINFGDVTTQIDGSYHYQVVCKSRGQIDEVKTYQLAIEKLLEFMNTVDEPQQIVRLVEDDPTHKIGPPRAYGIRPTLAQRIIATRNKLPHQRFDSLQQLDEIFGIGPDTLHDMIYTFRHKVNAVRETECTGIVLWRSYETFTSKAAAEQSFGQVYQQLIELASNRDNYAVGGDLEIKLLEDQRPIAFVPREAFQGRSSASVIMERLHMAKSYPIRLEGQQYFFQLYNIPLRQRDWVSTGRFDTERTARRAFEVFLLAAREPANYLKHDQPGPCIFRLSVQNILLESKDTYPGTGTLDDEVWTSGVRNFLSEATHDEAYYPFVDYPNQCRYSFRVVDDYYRLASHPFKFQTRKEREEALFWLCGRATCQDQLYSRAYFRYCQQFDQYHYLVTNDHRQPLWKSHTGYATAGAAETAYNEAHISLLNIAREEDFYQPLMEINGRFRVGLSSAGGSLLAVSPQTFANESELEAAIKERIMHARRYPFFELDKRVGFRLYSLEAFKNAWSTPGLVGGQTIWESIQLEKNEFCANRLLERFVELLRDKRNYQRVDHHQCGPFAIELTDPKRVLACHPVAYDLYEDVQAAIRTTKGHLNNEGFHLVEHILLRPRTGKSVQYVVQVVKDDYHQNISSQVFNDKQAAEQYRVQVLKQLRGSFSKLESRSSATDVVDLVQFMQQADRGLDTIGLKTMLSAETNKALRRGELVTRDIIRSCEAQLRVVNLVEETAGDTLLPNCPVCDPPLTVALPIDDPCSTLDSLAVSYIPGADPYSFWVTVVIPYWPARFQNTNFREFFESTLRLETPAHISLRIVWVSPEQMKAFEVVYRNWLTALSGSLGCNLSQAQTDLINVMFNLKNIYPSAQLFDCEDDPNGNPLVLEQSQLD